MCLLRAVGLFLPVPPNKAPEHTLREELDIVLPRIAYRTVVDLLVSSVNMG